MNNPILSLVIPFKSVGYVEGYFDTLLKVRANHRPTVWLIRAIIGLNLFGTGYYLSLYLVDPNDRFLQLLLFDFPSIVGLSPQTKLWSFQVPLMMAYFYHLLYLDPASEINLLVYRLVFRQQNSLSVSLFYRSHPVCRYLRQWINWVMWFSKIFEIAIGKGLVRYQAGYDL